MARYTDGKTIIDFKIIQDGQYDITTEIVDDPDIDYLDSAFDADRWQLEYGDASVVGLLEPGDIDNMIEFGVNFATAEEGNEYYSDSDTYVYIELITGEISERARGYLDRAKDCDNFEFVE